MVRQVFTVSLWLLCSVCVPTALAGHPNLGQNADLNGWLPFPPGSAWNKDISGDPVDPLSDVIIASIGTGAGLHADFGPTSGIPYNVVSGSQRKVRLTLSNYGESDAMMLPIPPDAAIEGGGNGGPGDSHGLILDRDNYMIYEIYDVTTERLNGGKLWHSSCCAIFNGAGTNTIRPRYWTSTDAAGLSVFAGLLKYQEIYVEQQLRHCVRFTAVNTRRAFLPPATHYASSLTGTNYIPMGAKVRLKASYPTYILSGGTKVVADGLKKYGMIMADNGANWYVSGAPDSRWTSEIGGICMLGGSDFEVVKMVGLVSQ